MDRTDSSGCVLLHHDQNRTLGEKEMKENHLKGLVHVFLAVLGAVELFNCTSKARKFVLGTAVGWHAHATFYHLVLEKETNEKDSTSLRARSSGQR